MIDRVPLLALLALASLPANTAFGAATGASRNYSVTSFDRIRVDGAYQVKLTTGVSPFARARGASNAALDGVAVRVEGRTLIIGQNSSSWGGYPGDTKGPVTIEVGTPNLNAAWLNGAGSLAINRARGLSFDLNIQGAGTATIDRVEVDQMKIGIAGTGSARVVGKALRLTAIVRGSSNFDGQTLSVKDATIGAEGPSIVKLAVSDTAKVNALGLTAVTLTGSPACTVKAQGSATVTGCK